MLNKFKIKYVVIIIGFIVADDCNDDESSCNGKKLIYYPDYYFKCLRFHNVWAVNKHERSAIDE